MEIGRRNSRTYIGKLRLCDDPTSKRMGDPLKTSVVLSKPRRFTSKTTSSMCFPECGHDSFVTWEETQIGTS